MSYRERMNRIRALWPYLKRYVVDAIIVLVAVGGVIEVLSIPEVGSEEGVPDTEPWLAVLVVLLMTLPFLARRQRPFAAPAFVCVVAVLTSYAEPLLIPWTFVLFLGILAKLLLLRNGRGQGAAPRRYRPLRGDDRNRRLVRRRTSWDEYFWVSVISGMVWVAGYALKRKLVEAEVVRGRLEREREERTREAVAEERARLARELHDVVGHSVSVMTVQASAVRRLLLPEQEKEREALEVVEQTGRQALAEMRRLVGVLRRPEEAPTLAPQPSLEYLEKLVAHVRESGLPVDLRVEGEAVRLPASLDLTAYRLIQEGLTNALKHAKADRAEVIVRYGADELELEVADNGTGKRGRQGRRPRPRRHARACRRVRRRAGSGAATRGRVSSARAPAAGGDVSELPAGTVTFLFSDVEGSTALLRRLRDRYTDVLEDHRRLLRDGVRGARGHEVGTEGDSFFVAFTTRPSALAAAASAQQALAAHDWPEDADVRVRMGIHTGQVSVSDGHYIGLAVHRAARICGAGEGGQVLVSQATRALLHDDDPEAEGLALNDLGERTLKDFDRPIRIFELLATDRPRGRAVHSRSDRRRPGARPHRLPHDPRGREGHRGRRGCRGRRAGARRGAADASPTSC